MYWFLGNIRWMGVGCLGLNEARQVSIAVIGTKEYKASIGMTKPIGMKRTGGR
jgi:hypothetical protein